MGYAAGFAGAQGRRNRGVTEPDPLKTCNSGTLMIDSLDLNLSGYGDIVRTILTAIINHNDLKVLVLIHGLQGFDDTGITRLDADKYSISSHVHIWIL